MQAANLCPKRGAVGNALSRSVPVASPKGCARLPQVMPRTAAEQGNICQKLFLSISAWADMNRLAKRPEL
jgi:hypothetical protein